MWGLIVFLVVGIIAGFIARALVPGDDSMGILGTMVLGIVGSFVGGVIFSFFGDGPTEFTASGVIGSVLGAIIALVAYNAITGRKKAA